MSELAPFLIAALVLATAVAGAARWRRQAADDPSLNSIVGGTVLVLTTVVSLVAAPFWWLDLEGSFPWDLPPAASRLFAVAALAFGAAGVLAIERPTPRRTRLYLTMVAAYLCPLFVASIFHSAVFDLTRVSTWLFFLVTGFLSLSAALELLRVYTVHPGLAATRLETAVIQLWLVMIGLAMAGWSLALFLAPDTLYPAVFLWPDDALTSRAIGAMLLSIGVAALLAMQDAASSRMALLFAGVYGAGTICAFSLTKSFAFNPPLLYLIGIGGMGLVSLAFLALLVNLEAPVPRQTSTPMRRIAR